MDEINPESGVVEGQYSGIGRTQGANEGSGEGGGIEWSKMSKKQYGDLGRAFQAQQVGSNITESGLNAGFDNSWLSTYENSGSANGQHL